MFEGQFELVAPFALDELRVALGAVTLCEVDAVLSLSGGGLVTGSVRAGLDDVHYRTVLVRIAADIEWVATHQYPPHRINAYVEFHLGQSIHELNELNELRWTLSELLPFYYIAISWQALRRSMVRSSD